MSTAVNPVIPAIAKIEDSVVKYSPLAISTIMAIEQAAAHIDGQTKLQIAVKILGAAAGGVEQLPNTTIAAFGGMVNFFVAMFNAVASTGLFQHKAAPVAPAVVK